MLLSKRQRERRRERRRKRKRERNRMKLRCMQACLERYDDTRYGISSLNNILIIGVHVCADRILVKPVCTSCIFTCFFQMSPFGTALLFKDSNNSIVLCSRQLQKYQCSQNCKKVYLIAITYHMQALKTRGIYHRKRPDLIKVRRKAKAAAQIQKQIQKEKQPNSQAIDAVFPSIITSATYIHLSVLS